MKPKYFIPILLIAILVSCGDVDKEGKKEVVINNPIENPSEQEITEKFINYYTDPIGYAYDDIGMSLSFTGSLAWAHVVGLGPICSSSDIFCEVEVWDSYTVAGPYIYYDWESEASLSFSANLCEYPPQRMYAALATIYDEYWNLDTYFSDFVFVSLAANQSSAIHADTGARVGDILYRDGPPLGFGHAAIYYGKDKYGQDLLIESNTITDVCDNTTGGVRVVYASDSLAGNHWYGAFYPDTSIDWIDLIVDGECQLGSRYDFINTHQPVTSCGAANGAFRCDGFTHYVYGEQGVDLSVSLLEIPSPFSQMMRDNLRARRPKMIGLDVNPSIFEPSLGENISISLKGTNSDLQWTAIIKNSSGHAVRTIHESGKWETFFWDGTDDGGSYVPAGDYSINASATSSGSGISYYRDSTTVMTKNVTVVHTASCPDGSSPTVFCGGPSCIPGWDFVPGDVLISFNDGISRTTSDAIISDIISVLLASGSSVEYHSLIDIYEIHLPSSVSIGCAISVATGYPEVSYAGPNTIVHAFGSPPAIETVDSDEDTIENSADNCPSVHNISQSDIDGDGVGDACDPDKDGDGYLNTDDDFPMDVNEWIDSDGDGLGDNADYDDDGDQVVDSMDAFPYNPSEFSDTDEDGVGDNADIDDDNDGIYDDEDLFPRDPLESTDNDGDRIGDNSDPDDDNDGYSDEVELREGTNPLDQVSIPLDFDHDFNPDSTDPDDDGDHVPDDKDFYPNDSTRWKKESSVASPEEVTDVISEEEFNMPSDDQESPSVDIVGASIEGANPVLSCNLIERGVNKKDQALLYLVFVAIAVIYLKRNVVV